MPPSGAFFSSVSRSAPVVSVLAGSDHLPLSKTLRTSSPPPGQVYNESYSLDPTSRVFGISLDTALDAGVPPTPATLASSAQIPDSCLL